jgi:hypothetical protein
MGDLGSLDCGTLYRWDATTAAWVVHATDIALNIRFTDNQKQKKVTDLFHRGHRPHGAPELRPGGDQGRRRQGQVAPRVAGSFSFRLARPGALLSVPA